MTRTHIFSFLIEKLFGLHKPIQDAGNGLHELLQNENLRIIYQDKLGVLYEPPIEGETPHNNNLTSSNTINFSFEIECLQALSCSYCSKSMKILNKFLSFESLFSAILIIFTIYTHFSSIPIITCIIILTILFIEILLKLSSSLNLNRLTKILQSLMYPFSYINDSSQNINTPNNLPPLYFSLFSADCLFFESLATQLSIHLKNNLFSKKNNQKSAGCNDPILKIQAALENQQSSYFTSRYVNNKLENKKSQQEITQEQILSDQQNLIHDQSTKNINNKQISVTEEGLIMLQTAYRKDQFIKEAFSELYRFIQFKVIFLQLKLLILIILRKECSEVHNNDQISHQDISQNATMALIFEIAMFLIAFLRVATQIKISSIYIFRNDELRKIQQKLIMNVITSISDGILIILLGNTCELNINLERFIIGVYFVSAMIVFFMEDGNKNTNNQYGQLYRNTINDFEVNNQDFDINNSDFPRQFLEPKINTFLLNSSVSNQKSKQSMCIIQLLIGLCLRSEYPYSASILMCLNLGMLIFYYARSLQEKRNHLLSQLSNDPNLFQSSPRHIIYTGQLKNLHSNEFIKKFLIQLVQSSNAHIILSFPQDQVKLENQFGHVEIFMNNPYNGTLIRDIQNLMANFCHSYVFKILNVALLQSQFSFILHTILFEFDTQHNLALCPINYLLQLPVSDKNKYYFLPLIHQMQNNKLIQIMKVSTFYQQIAPSLFQNPGAVLYDLLMLDD